jgi:hypothetical protein
VSRVIVTGVHEVDDLDSNPAKKAEEIAREWVQAFGAKSMGRTFRRRCGASTAPLWFACGSTGLSFSVEGDALSVPV